MNTFPMKRKTSKEIVQNLSQESNTKIQKTVFKAQKARDIMRKTAKECGPEQDYRLLALILTMSKDQP